MKLVELKVNHVDAPLGFQITPLSFSWKTLVLTVWITK